MPSHIAEVQVTIPNYKKEHKALLESLGKRFEKDHNKGAKKRNEDGFQMSPFVECIQTRFVSKRICKILGPGRKIYLTFRLYHESISEQNMAVHQLKREMKEWRADLAVKVAPVPSYKELYYANAHLRLYCELKEWLNTKVEEVAKKIGVELKELPELELRVPIIYSI